MRSNVPEVLMEPWRTRLLARRRAAATDIDIEVDDQADPFLQLAALVAAGQESAVDDLQALPDAAKRAAEALRNDDPHVRVIAVKVLPHTGGKDTEKALVSALGDPAPEVRIAAAETLAAIGTALTKHLAPLLADPDVEVRRTATRLLGKTGDKAAAKLLLDRFETADRRIFLDIVDALGALGASEAIPTLAPILRFGESELRARIASTFGRIGDAKAAPALGAALVDEYPPVRAAAAEALGILGDDDTADALAALLEDPEPQVRGAAAIAITSLGDPRALPMVVELLADPSFEHERALQAVGKLGAKAVGDLIPFLDDVDSHKAAAAARAIAETGSRSKETIAALVTAAETGRPPLPEAAIEALGRIGAPAVEALAPLASSKKDTIRAAVIATLGRIGGEKAMSLVVAALRDPDDDVRFAAARALEVSTDPSAVWGLINVLRDGSEAPAVRIAAARALTRLGGDNAKDALAMTLTTRIPTVRFAAALALTRLGDARAIDTLVHTLDKNDASGFEEVVAALRDLGTPAHEPLFALLLEASDSDVRLKAGRILHALRIPEALGPMVHALKDTDSRVVNLAIDAVVDLELVAAGEA